MQKHKQESAATKKKRNIFTKSNLTIGKNTMSFIWLILAVSMIVIIIHWSGLSSQALSFDDDQYLVNNKLVQSPGIDTAERFISEVLWPSTVSGYYQPLTMISLMIDYALGGRPDNLWMFHFTSLIIHLINTILIILLLYRLFRSKIAAALTGLLFGLHPMTVETLYWVGERKTLLASLFSLAAILLYLYYTDRRSKKLYIASVFAFILALMSKPTSVPLPLLLILIDIWPLNRLNIFPLKNIKIKLFIDKIPFIVLSTISAIITYLSQKNTASVLTPDKYDPLHIPLVLCHNIIFYLYKIIFPFNLTSNYPNPVPMSLGNPVLLIAVLGTIALFCALFISLKRTKAYLTGWLFFFAAILPTMGIIGFTNVLTSDKYAYLPSFGLLMILAWLFTNLLTRSYNFGILSNNKNTIFIVLIISLSLGESIITINYTAKWKDDMTLTTYMLNLAPQSDILNNYYGSLLFKKGKDDEALAYFNKALQKKPYKPSYNNNVGAIKLKEGKFVEALSYFDKVVQTDPAYGDVYYNIGQCMMQLGKTNEAIENFKKSIQYKPDFLPPYKSYATIFLDKNDLNGALNIYMQAVDKNVADDEILLRCGLIYMDTGNTIDAKYYLNKVIEVNPNNSEAFLNLGVIFGKENNLKKADECFRQAIQANPESIGAYKNLAISQIQQNKVDDAIKLLQNALKIEPNNSDILQMLDYITNKQK